MTPQSGHLELDRVETQGVQPSPDMGPDANKLSSSALKLARNLAWMPGQEESRHLRDRCETLYRSLQPLLMSLESRVAMIASDDFRRLQENVFLLRGEFQETCGTFHAQEDVFLQAPKIVGSN